MTTESAPVLVTGATGRQGGATARALLAMGIGVRALVRDPASGRAQTVEGLGAGLVTGDLDDRGSLVRAAQGARAVFSVQMPDLNGRGLDGEVAQAINLIEAAREAGVPQFVHTSVSGAGQHTDFPGWAEGRWASMEPYFATKTKIQDRVREAGFRHWTIIKPGVFMENFLPAEKFMIPRGVENGLVTVLKPGTPIPLVAVEDIGRTAAAAIAEPARFHQVELDLASDYLTMTAVAGILSRHLGADLAAPDMTLDEAIAAGITPAGASHEFINVTGLPARPEFARALDLPLTSFDEWGRLHLPTAG